MREDDRRAFSAPLIRYYAGWAAKIGGTTANVSIGIPNTEFHAWQPVA